MIKYYITIIILFSTLIAIGQTIPPPAIQWQKSLGTFDADFAYSIIQTNGGGFLVAGIGGSNNSGDITDNHGTFDAWLIKFDSLGLIEWKKSYGGSGADGAKCIQKTKDSGYIMVGTTSSIYSGINTIGGGDVWIVKLDKLGNIKWQKNYGGSYGEGANAVKETPDGSFIIAGISNSNDGFVSGHHGSVNTKDSYDFWIIKLNSSGTLQWQKSFGGSKNEIAKDIEIASDGGYIIIGTSTSTDGDISHHYGTIDNEDIWILKISNSGNIEWDKSFGGSLKDEGTSIKNIPNNGGFIFTGTCLSNDNDINNANLGYSDGIIVKLSSTGNVLWKKNIGGSLNDGINSIQIDNDGGFIVCGFSFSNDYDVSCPHNNDMWVVKLDKTGSIIWQKTLGGWGEDIAYSINPTIDNGYIIAGTSFSTDVDITVGEHHGSYNDANWPDYWIIKLKFPTVAITTSSNNICKGSNVVFTATTSVLKNPKYKWFLNNTQLTEADSTFNTTTLQNGDSVYCTIYNDETCQAVTSKSNTIIFNVTDISTPILQLSPNSISICEGDVVKLNAFTLNAGNSPLYVWKVNSKPIITVTGNIYEDSTFKNNDTVIATVTNPNILCNGFASDTIIIKVNPIPIVVCMPDTIIIKGTPINLHAVVSNNVIEYSWSPSSSLNNSTILTPKANPNLETFYKLKVTTKEGCSNYDEVIVTPILPIKIPNAFSPNGDAINDYWIISGIKDYPNCKVDIFNRNGNIIFSSVGYAKPWDGFYKNSPLPIGTYYYIIDPKIKNINKIIGDITILR